jgi:hypothetical protein
MSARRRIRVVVVGPDRTGQWRVVREDNGDVLMDGFGHPTLARAWAEQRDYQQNPYWLQGSRRRYFVTPTAKLTKAQKDAELAVIGHVEFEDEPEARKRRATEKATKKRQLSERMAAIARRPQTMLRRVVAVGGISKASMKTWPGDKNLLRDAKVRGLVRQRGGMEWEQMASQMRTDGYLPGVDLADAGMAFVDLLEDSLRGGDVFSTDDADAIRSRDERQMQREHMARSRDQRASERRKANPHLLTLGNPSPVTAQHMEAARAAYRRFHGVDPKPGQIRHGDGNGILIALGELRRIDYQPRRGDRQGPTWFHHFKAGCVLCTSPDGRRLVILDRHGKRLVDFDRGIVR